MRHLFIALILLPITPIFANAEYTLESISSIAETHSFELQEMKNAAGAARLNLYARLGEFSPEIGAEGNWRYDQEKEKFKDLSYYGYGRLNVFRGFSDFQRWRAASELNRIHEIRAARAQEQLRLKVRKAYLRVLTLQQITNLIQEHFKITEQQLAMARKKINGGLATEADVYDFNIHQTSLKSEMELLSAELIEAWQALEVLAGQSLDSSKALARPSDLEVVIDEQQLMASALGASDIVLDARIAEASTRADKWATLGELMPRADIDAKFGKLFESDFGESHKNSWAIVGTVSIPIFDGFRRLNDSRSKDYELDKAITQRARAELEAKNSTRLLFEKVRSLSKRLGLEEEKLKQSAKYYDITLSEYRRGVKNSPDLASASDRLFDAKKEALEIRQALESAKADLLISTGFKQ